MSRISLIKMLFMLNTGRAGAKWSSLMESQYFHLARALIPSLCQCLYANTFTQNFKEEYWKGLCNFHFSEICMLSKHF